MTGREDVITLLQRQHEEIRQLFGEVDRAYGDARRAAFRRLVRLLSVHETAEEEFVHPMVRHQDGGQPVVEARLDEERRAKDLLSTMDGMGPDGEGFDTLLIKLRKDVLAHAEHEEREEFPLLRKAHSPKWLEAMGRTVRAAEAVAPTRPHPGLQGATANVLLGPPVAIMDRTRDAIRKTLGRH
jgi:hemerythrin superfamily protein